jgi:hypothetical protein
VKKLFASLFVVFLGFQLAACSSSDDETACAVGGPCAFTGGEWQACCSSSQCTYITPGTDFPCAGTNCAGAPAASLVSYCSSGSAKIGSDTESELFKALAVEKADNVLLRLSIDQLYKDLGKEVNQNNQ